MSVLLVAGAGPGVGAALEKRFSREGYAVALAARSAKPGATTFPADLSREKDVVRLFDAVESGLGAIGVVAFVAATRREAPLVEVTADDFERHWRQNTFAGFLVGREAARRMLPRGRGTILFTGASTSFRGRARFAAFSAAKGGLRFLAQRPRRRGAPGRDRRSLLAAPQPAPQRVDPGARSQALVSAVLIAWQSSAASRPRSTTLRPSSSTVQSRIG